MRDKRKHSVIERHPDIETDIDIVTDIETDIESSDKQTERAVTDRQREQ